jgi:hypothetical protein
MALLVGGFGCTDDAKEGAMGDPPAEVLDCSALPDFADCLEEAAAGLCVLGVCQPLSPCPASGCGDPGPHFPLSDTNLRVCVGPSEPGVDGTIPCPGVPGEPACATTDYCGQDAQYGWDAAQGDGARFSVTPSDTDEALVTDSVTGLVWQQCAGGQTGAGCAGEATLESWYDGVAHCEASTWGGVDDWTLPNSFELQSIVDYSTTSPAFDRSVFVNAPSTFLDDTDQWWIECIWSASDYARDPTVAWVLMSNNGDFSEGSGREYHLNDKAIDGWPGCYTRCVRQSARPTWRRMQRVVTEAGEPVVADMVTKHLWQGCSAGQTGRDCAQAAHMIDWKSALAYCEGLTWAGYDDWRLPNIKTLRSIVDDRRESPAIDPVAFPNTPHYGPDLTDNIGHYWSSTGRAYNNFALYVDFGVGFSHFYIQPEPRHVRCVRGG